MKNNKWKDFLLKSGIPLEYEVYKTLEKNSCISSFEYSYIRNDENYIPNEFSFDIDSSYIDLDEYNFFKLLIECKYRDDSTSWLFLPATNPHTDYLSPESILHQIDEFNKKRKYYFDSDSPKFAKSCLKGIELNSEGQNPKTITQAVNQLSFGMAEIVSDSIKHQIGRMIGGFEYIFYNVPIIVTTANLYRLKDDVSIKTIKKTDNILDVATKEDCLIMETNTSIELKEHNKKIFNNLISKYDEKHINLKFKNLHNGFRSHLEKMAEHSCPKSILIIQHTEDGLAFKKLFNFLDEIIEQVGKYNSQIKKDKFKK